MINISLLFQKIFTPASNPGDESVDKNSSRQPRINSLQTCNPLPETYFMSEIESDLSQKNNVGPRFDKRRPDSISPSYQVPVLTKGTNQGNVENPGSTWTDGLKGTSQISVDAFLQHINRSEISLLQSDIEAGFKCDETYRVGGKSMTPFQYAMWQGNGDAMQVLLPHTSRNHIVLAFLEANDASLEELVKILPAAREILTTLESQSDWKYPVAQCANFIARIEARL